MTDKGYLRTGILLFRSKKLETARRSPNPQIRPYQLWNKCRANTAAEQVCFRGLVFLRVSES